MEATGHEGQFQVSRRNLKGIRN